MSVSDVILYNCTENNVANTQLQTRSKAILNKLFGCTQDIITKLNTFSNLIKLLVSS